MRKTLLSEKEGEAIWGQVYRRFQFAPSINRDVIPFQLPKPWAVYDISRLYVELADDSVLERLTDGVNRVLLSCMAPGERLYALDWHHSNFLYDPQNREDQQSLFVEDERYQGGGYNADFPSYIPDGDYYFFLAQDFRMGYFGHPWRQEVWIFGERLVDAFQAAMEREPAFAGFRLKETSQ